MYSQSNCYVYNCDLFLIAFERKKRETENQEDVPIGKRRVHLYPIPMKGNIFYFSFLAFETVKHMISS